MLDKRSGFQVLPLDEAPASLHIEAVVYGIANGWFLWPVNFDPVWLQRCDGYTPKADGTSTAEDAVAKG